MLRHLSVRNLAVIEHLAVDFEPGLNVLTGETGAGKSIVVGAVGLLLGGRAAADLVRTGKDFAAVEGIFERPDGCEILLRREISAQGRSRGFIDGGLATTSALRELGATLVDLHGQHEHQVLLDPAVHLDVLDEFVGAGTTRARVAERFAEWQRLHHERMQVAARQQESAARSEFLAFQLAEIDRIAPRPREDEELGAVRTVLANAERVRRFCAEAYQALYEGDNAALPILGQVWRRVGELAAIDGTFAPHMAARDAIKAQLEDLAYFLRAYTARLDASPERLQEVEDRLAALERLKKKHGPSLDGVIAHAAELRRDLDEVEHVEETAAALEAMLAAARTAYVESAGLLTEQRRAAAPKFAAALERTLAELAMSRTRCEIKFDQAGSEAQWTERGVETGEIYISPNVGEDLRPLARIASGGELSRVMLALKTLASIDAPGKTLIFDEVDTGIGGAVADVVGGRLQQLAGRVQVLCITHLPQIAAHGSTHFRIVKAIRQGRTVTDVTRLGPAEREEELARMIGGTDVSRAVRTSAREMLAARHRDR